MTDSKPPTPAAVPVRARPTHRRDRTPFIGPLFSWELIRLARRGQDARARTILALVLFLTLFAFTVIWFPDSRLSDLFFGSQQLLDIQDTAQFAEQFALALLLAQMAVMVLIAPAYAAGAVAEEKERKTFTNLLTTELSNREIVFGKFFARMVFLLGVMLAGLPILSLTGLIGGIDPLFLVLSYGLTATTVVLISAVSIASAVYAGTFRGAMFRAYGLTALYVLFGCGLYPLLSPFAVLVMFHLGRADMNAAQFVMLGAYVLAQLLIAGGALWLAVRRVRAKQRGKPPTPYRERSDRSPRRRSEIEVVEPVDEEHEVLVPDDQTAGTTTVQTAIAIPAKAVTSSPRTLARPVRRRDEDDGRPRRPHRPAYEPPEVANRPPVFANDPFFWKERYTLGTRRTADEESIRGVVVVVGAIVVTLTLFVASIALLIALVNPTRGSEDAVAQTLILTGVAGVFAHFLTLGSAACQAVLRERQRATLESLLTLPVERRAILGPKWRVSFGRGWWWGGPGIVAIVIGLFVSRIPLAAAPAVLYLPAAAAFGVSIGLWLSIRSRTTARAMMWFMTIAGCLLLIPVATWWGFDEYTADWAVGILAIATAVVGIGAWAFWQRACRDFDQYGRV